MPLSHLFACVWLFAAPVCAASSAVDADVLLRGGLIFDGGGAEGRPGDVAIQHGRIAAVGQFPIGKVQREIDCRGLVVAPGFIDLHTHSDAKLGDPQNRPCLNYLLQGCTTMVTGNCGGGPADVAKFLSSVDASGAGANVIHLIPHGTVRSMVMRGERREPTAAELSRMKSLIDKGMREGAWGMSTGLIYPPSSYAKTDELVELAKVVAARGGLYASHIRNEGNALLKAVDEAIAIGRQSGAAVEISHFKAAGKANWGRIRDAAAAIERARGEGLKITADQYPYAASSTGLDSTLLPDAALPGGRINLQKRMAVDPELKRLVREVIGQSMKRSAKIVIAACKKHPECAGKSLEQLAAAQNCDPVDAALKILADGGAEVINHSMSEDDVRWAMTLPWVGLGSDGSARAPRPNEFPHPRNFGALARKIGYCAIEQKWLPLGQAIRSCSGLPADILGLSDRGYLRAGYVADVTVFDPRSFRDRATYEQPQQYAVGMRCVFIGGQAAVDDGRPSATLYGRAIRHGEK